MLPRASNKDSRVIPEMDARPWQEPREKQVGFKEIPFTGKDCPARCPHCDLPCRIQGFGAAHKGRHETPPPPGAKNGHTWPNAAHVDAESIEARLEAVAVTVENSEYNGLYVHRVATEIRAIRSEYLRRRYRAQQRRKR